ncbi:MAG: DUF2911 domain-containing protein [Roseivirga sp.]|nr:DUF2911 domain-containing protein [Roseivirga sp.]
MNKYLKRGLIIAAVLGILLYAAYLFMVAQTKKHSPEETVNYNTNGYGIEVFYNRPSKKGREIFGRLVPFGRVWRTGANEATTFETSTDLTIDGKPLKAGKYTLWTIPDADNWTLMFNAKQYSWGVNRNGVTREAEHDVLQVKVPVESVGNVVELFTIALEDRGGKPVLALIWDQTRVAVVME